ncbi:hypothetical protein MYU51_018283 [Penicillium brevicompactum]
MSMASPTPDLSSPRSSISSTSTRPRSEYIDENGVYVYNDSSPFSEVREREHELGHGHTCEPQSPSYACLFHTLDCHEAFDDVDEWRTHITSHFRSHPTPSTARCPMCANTKFVDGVPGPVSSPIDSHSPSPSLSLSQPQSPSPSPSAFKLDPVPSAWDRMLDHVADFHYSTGQTLAGSRPDFELMRYLYGMRVITDAQFKAMQLPPAPSSPAYHRAQDGVRASIGSADEPYCAPYSKRREQRMRQQRGVGVV